jgi:hypothetical protein
MVDAATRLRYLFGGWRRISGKTVLAVSTLTKKGCTFSWWEAEMNASEHAQLSNKATDKAPRRNIVFFREAEAPSLHDAGVMENKNSPVANLGIAKMVDAGLGDGYVLKCLFKAPEPDGFCLSYAWFKGNYELPPHKHNTDCLYYVISGEIHMGGNVLRAGDGFFLPGGAGYSYSAGPEGLEVLEIRNSTRFDITVRDGSEKAWTRLAEVCAANRDIWKTQRPPLRVPQV